ncbi:MAG: hypothetical protein PF448_04350 [Bacteroidales bacterium]|nr:hypothetical protein [Bacteroidales bacterium]
MMTQTNKPIMRYSESQINDLPKPVKNYFEYCLKPGQAYAKSCSLTHVGWFKTAPERPAMPIKGTQAFNCRKPEFVWTGKTKAFKAIDKFVEGEGQLSVYLFGFLRIVNEKGKEVSEAEMLRWLGESVWFPTNLLPSEHLSWLPKDEHTAVLQYRWKDFEIAYDVQFNEKWQITALTCMRHMGKDGYKPWIGRVNDYKEINGMFVPMKISASWSLDEGEYQYANFEIEELNHQF